jgi:uncharacterized membrane protein
MRFLRSFGGLVQIVAVVIMVGLLPYTAFAGYELYLAVSGFAGGPIGPVVYAVARLVACMLLGFALWRLRQASSRLRARHSA